MKTPWSGEPSTGLARAARLARLGVRSVASLATGGDASAIAGEVATTLADLRGLAAKAGQIGAYLDAVVGKDVPPGVREALQRLNASTTHSAFEAITEVIREDLGGEADAVLAGLDPHPVGSGSVAQVHRGRMPDGRAVAVKVQHPGVARVLLAELSQAGLVVRAAGMVMPGAGDVYEEVRARFVDELDQRKEAEATRAFGVAMAGVPGVEVPAVIDAWCGPRVLTTSWAEGIGLDEAATTLPPLARDAAGLALLRAFAAGVAAGGVHADPNAGNFLFRGGGEVTILDLGCVQGVPPAEAASLLRALATADDRGFGALFGPTTGPAGEATRALAARMLAPLAGDGPITRPHLHAIAHAVQHYKATLAKTRSGTGPAWSPLVLRAWVGLLAHVHHLGSRIDGPALRAWIGAREVSAGATRSA